MFIYLCLSGYILVFKWLYTCVYVVIYLCLSGYILVYWVVCVAEVYWVSIDGSIHYPQFSKLTGFLLQQRKGDGAGNIIIIFQLNRNKKFGRKKICISSPPIPSFFLPPPPYPLKWEHCTESRFPRMLVDFTLSAVPYSYTYPGSSPTPILFILPSSFPSYPSFFPFSTLSLSILPSSFPFYS